MNSNIDFIIVGAGLYGVTCARQLTDVGYKCLIIEKRTHIGGNCYTEKTDNGIDVHKYGPHIFHTSDYNVMQFIMNYGKFNMYVQNTLACDGKKIYSLPFNMHTFYQLFGTVKPEDAKQIITKEIHDAKVEYEGRDDLEATACKTCGKTVFNKLIKNYTEKQWNKKCSELPGDIIKRLPIRYKFDNNYFDDYFCGIPRNGYTDIVQRMIDGTGYDKVHRERIPCILNTDFLQSKDYWLNLPRIGIIYCGAVDEFFDYELGELEWRSLSFIEETYTYNGTNGQGCAVMNDVSNKNKFTRKIEHMYFTPEYMNSLTLPCESVVTTEYPDNYKRGNERYYPINDQKNNELYDQYVKLLNERYPNVLLGGRIGLYKYFDMDKTIHSALATTANIIKYLKEKNE